MDIDFVGIVFRWLHILSAIAAVGATIFQRVALVPALAELPEETRRAVQQAVRARWAKFVMIAIALLLVSGFYNVAVIATRYELPGYYMPLFGIKFLLAMAIFFISSALVGRSAALENIRRNARFWLGVNTILAIVLVCISGVLRMARKPEKPRTTASALVEASIDTRPRSITRAQPRVTSS